MPAPLLTTKLYRPPSQAKLVARLRLVERLNSSLAGKLSLISAPAGFGKTTLLAEWLYAENQSQASLYPSNIAWLSLDEGDNDLARFFTYFIAALQQVDPHIGQALLPTLQTSTLPPTETLLVMLVNDIVSAAQPLLLVLDDYHVIKNQAIHHALDFLLDHLPPAMHLVISGRADPPLHLSRLRVRREITELRADDLRFTPDEAAQFFNDLFDLDLSPADIAALDARTEGWIASLQLLALAMQSPSSHTNKQAFVDAFSGSHRYVIDYLVEEVMAHQPGEIRQFLQQTAILERFCAPLCDATLQISNSRQILARLEAANLFLVPLDDERRWYRYHHLFADFLRQRLQSEAGDQIAGLHRRAARWFESENLAGEAVQHWLAVEDYEAVVRLLEIHAMPTILQGHARTMERWLRALPPEWQSIGPRTNLAFAWMLLLRGQYSEVAGYLQNAKTSAARQAKGKVETEATDIQCEVLALRGVLTALQDDPAAGTELVLEAIELAPAENVYLQGLVYFSLGTTYNYAGQAKPAIAAYRQAIPLCQAAGNRMAAVLCATNLSMLAYARGQLHLAVEVCQQVLDALEPQHRTPALGGIYATLGMIYYEWNRLDTAHDHLQQGLTWGRLVGHPAALSFSLVSLSRVYQAQGKEPDAAIALQEAVDLLQQAGAPAWVTPEIINRQVELALHGGDLRTVENVLQESGIGLEDEAGQAIEMVHLAWLRRLRAEGRQGEGLVLAHRLQKSAEAGARTGRLIQILVQRSLLHQTQNEFEPALDALHRALLLAEPEGYIRTFVDEGQPMKKLLPKIQAQDDRIKKYVAVLLNAFETTEPIQPLSFSPQPLIEPLSDRELEILHLMADGLSNPEIAQQLIITPGTVKVHVHNIYGKLGVSGRVKAVAKAKELNLL